MGFTRLLLTALLYIQAGSSFGQKQPSSNALIVFVSPAIVRAPGVETGIQAGLQQEWRNWAVNVEGALPLRKRHDDFSKIQVVRFGFEVKRFIAPMEDAKPYLSLQLNHTIRNLTDINGNIFASKADSGWVRYDRAFIQAPITSAALKCGIQFKAGKRFLFDSFAGLGARYIATTYKNVEGKTAGFAPRQTSWGNFTPQYQYEGSITKLHITAGMRIGYILEQ
jgi:hypothetical protein